MEAANRNRWMAVALGSAALIVLAVALYLFLSAHHLVPPSLDRYLVAALVAVVGVLSVMLIGRGLRRESEKRLGPDRAYRVLDVYRLAAYAVVALVVLYALGVNGTALLAGGTFAGLVIGLAAQTALGNVIAGVTLLIVRPFREGDRITITTWQYPFLGPAYPPKFYSDDLLVLGFTGVLRSIGLAYTVVRRDDGTLVRLPNNIVIQAAVLAHDVVERWVRTKYEVPPDVDPKVLLPLAAERLRQSPWVARPETLRVSIGAATMASYVVVVDAVCHGAVEEPPRSDFLIELIHLVGGLKSGPGRSPGPANRPAPARGS